MRKAEKYKEVWAISSLPTNNFLYEAQCDLTCRQCGCVIPANSYFGRKIKKGEKRPRPYCRACFPIFIYTGPNKTVVPQNQEYLHVKEPWKA